MKKKLELSEKYDKINLNNEVDENPRDLLTRRRSSKFGEVAVP